MLEKLSSSINETHQTHEPLKTLESAGVSADRFRVDPADYPIFSQQYELDSRWGNNTPHYQNIDKTLSRYVTQTANLISTLDGTSTEYTKNPELPIPDHVIYLDKSARPVSWLVNTFWSTFSDAKRPSSSYLNIDRQPWFRRSGIALDLNGYSVKPDGSYHRNTFSDFRPENIPHEDFARIRALYLPEGIKTEDPEAIMHTPSSLDGKNILIVDEVKRSGATLDIAKWLISQAFPDAADIRGAYFWDSGSKSSPDGTEQQMLSVPVWYDSSTSTGRGVGDIDLDFYATRHEKFQTDRTRAQKYGALVLSAIANLDTEVGQKSRHLMQEIRHMHKDYQDGRILLRFPKNYDGDRMADLIEAQGIRLAPSTDRSPDTFTNIATAIDARRPSSI